MSAETEDAADERWLAADGAPSASRVTVDAGDLRVAVCALAERADLTSGEQGALDRLREPGTAVPGPAVLARLRQMCDEAERAEAYLMPADVRALLDPPQGGYPS